MLLTLSGSARPDSSNRRLLAALPDAVKGLEFEFFDIHQLPLFSDVPDQPTPDVVNAFRGHVTSASGIIIATPEYAHNLPAALKNALEWLVASGKLAHKPILPITLTPHPPRGEKGMQSLCWTLAAMDARIVAQLPLYQTDVTYESPNKLGDCSAREMLLAALELL